ncbi:MAG: hypothetical protein ACRENG_04400 [bacterium]
MANSRHWFPGGRAEAIAVDGSEVVAQNIAKWNQATGKWEALGGGVDDDVFALVIDGNSHVYAGGNLTRGFNPDGATVFIWRIGKWNAQQSVWEPLGEGVFGPGSNNVTALAVDANGDVFVGRDFDGVYNPGRIAVNANAMARWNGTSWSPLGTHMLDVSNKANGYVIISLSGFLNPAANQNGPAAAQGRCC